MVNGNESWYSYATASPQTGVKLGTVNPCKIYPNPATDAFQITGIEGTILVTVSDLNGRLLLSKEITSNENISLSCLPNGLYLVGIKSNNATKTEKLIIQK